MKKIDIRDWLQTLQAEEEEPAPPSLLSVVPCSLSCWRQPRKSILWSRSGQVWEDENGATGWRLWCLQTEIWLDLWRCWSKNHMRCWGILRCGWGKSGVRCGGIVSRAFSSARARFAVEGEPNRLSLRSDAFLGERGKVAPKGYVFFGLPNAVASLVRLVFFLPRIQTYPTSPINFCQIVAQIFTHYAMTNICVQWCTLHNDKLHQQESISSLVI